ncbi:hypothetical protein [Dermatophilus congolensis]|nr:hypothetical protein [Dermatophilus congolensis]
MRAMWKATEVDGAHVKQTAVDHKGDSPNVLALTGTALPLGNLAT